MSAPNSPSDNVANNATSDTPGSESTPDSLQPWQCLPEETPKAYEAFHAFLSIRGRDRSVVAAYNAFLSAERQRTGKEPAKQARQASGQWNYWATLYKWQERARSYDDHLASIERQEREKERREQARRKEQKHLERLRDYREQLHDLNAAALSASILLMEKCVKRLESAKDEEIAALPISAVATMLKAATATSTTASDAQAQALAVDEILENLDASHESDSEEPSQ